MQKHTINEVGNKYNRLFVKAFAGTNKYRKALFLCVCDCGEEIITTGYALRSGTTKSCGCLQKEKASTSVNNYNTSEKRKQQPSPNKSHGMCKQNYTKHG